MIYKHYFTPDCLKGRHYFDGEPITDSAVNLCVDPKTHDSMIAILRQLAFIHNGIDGMQRFINAEGDVITFQSFLSKDEYFELEEEGETDLESLNRFHIYFSSAPQL